MFGTGILSQFPRTPARPFRLIFIKATQPESLRAMNSTVIRHGYALGIEQLRISFQPPAPDVGEKQVESNENLQIKSIYLLKTEKTRSSRGEIYSFSWL